MLSAMKLESLKNLGEAYRLAANPTANTFSGGFVVMVKEKIDGAIPHSGNWLVGYGSTCPHMGCLVAKVSYTSSTNRLVTTPCPCHGSTFDLTKAGLVVLGPATQNLPQLKLEISGEDLQAVDWLVKTEIDPTHENWPCNPDASSSTGVV